MKISLVGDPRQVTYHTHYGEKYKKYRDGNICKFIRNECKKGICEINDESLNISFRNNEMICNFSSKPYSDYKKCISGNKENTEHSGIFLIKEKDIEDYLERYEPINIGFWYDFGFYMAIISGFGELSFSREKKNKKKK